MKKVIVTVYRKGSSKYIDSIHLMAMSVISAIKQAEKVCKDKKYKDYWLAASTI